MRSARRAGAVALVLAAVLLIALLARRTRRTDEVPQAAPAPARPRSAWVSARAPVPRLAPSLAGVAPAADAGGDHDRLVVRAVDVTGGPIPGAAVVIADESARPLGTTGADGAAVIDLGGAGLPAAGRLAVSAEGYGRREAPYLAPTPVVVRLLPENRVAGVVVAAGSGSPLAGMTVRTAHRHTVTDAQGRFALGDLPPGDPGLEAHGHGRHGVPARAIALSIGTVVTDVRIEASPTAFTITGRVLAAGTPLPGVVIEAGTRRTTSDDAGRFRLSDVPVGRYELRAMTGFLSLSQPKQVEVTHRDVEADLDLGPRASLVVEVVEPGGRPLADHEVWLEQALDHGRTTWSERTDHAGRHRFEGLLPTRAKVGGQSVSPQTVDLGRPRPRPVRLVVRTGGRLQGQLQAPAGTPVADRSVLAAHADSAERFSVASAADGSFSFGAVPPGGYTITVRPGRAWNTLHPPDATANATVARGRTTDVAVPLAADDGTLAGTVVDARGAPVNDALVIYFRPGIRSFTAGSLGLGGGVEATVTGTDGRFAFTGVPPGRPYDVEARNRAGDYGYVSNASGDAIVVRLEAHD